jgi:hypothetical protein
MPITHIEFRDFFRTISFIKLNITTLPNTTAARIVDKISLGGARVANRNFNVGSSLKFTKSLIFLLIAF